MAQRQGVLSYASGRPVGTFWDEPAIDVTGNPAAPGIWTALPTRDRPLPQGISPWDVVYLNDVRAPGVARLEGGRHIPYDRKAALGLLVGAASFFVFDPVEFTLILTLWHPDQWTELHDLVPQLLPDPGPNPKPRAVRVGHPATQMLKVSTVYFEAMEMPRHIGNQIVEVRFQCFEWSPPVPVKTQDVDSAVPASGRPGTPAAPATPTAGGSGSMALPPSFIPGALQP
jgi:hypothetical protein